MNLGSAITAPLEVLASPFIDQFRKNLAPPGGPALWPNPFVWVAIALALIVVLFGLYLTI
jgi:hypothetical protein